MPEDREFGWTAEKKFFGGRVDWIKSRLMNISYIDNFLDALENNKELPAIISGMVNYRNPPVSMGADIVLEDEIIE